MLDAAMHSETETPHSNLDNYNYLDNYLDLEAPDIEITQCPRMTSKRQTPDFGADAQ